MDLANGMASRRCIRRLTAFASTLKKGNHVQIQCQLRTSEYFKDESKKTVTEIRVTSILKLDRSHKQPAAADQGEMREWPNGRPRARHGLPATLSPTDRKHRVAKTPNDASSHTFSH